MTADLRVLRAPAAGLTESEATDALERFGANTIPESRPPGVLSRVGTQLRDPMILLLLGAAVLTAALQDLADLTVIVAVVVLNTTVGVVQEVRAEHALAALRRLAAPEARVIRAGRTRVIAAAQVVPGDLVVLQAGDVVAADVRLTQAVRLQADESALTGESIPVGKEPGDEAFAGTVVTTGRGTGEVTRTGSASALGRIAVLLASQRPGPTPLQRRLTALSRALSIVVVVLAAVVAVIGLIEGRDLATMAVTAVSLTVAAVPESLPAVVTLALAIGAHRMALRSAVVRRLPAVETLGAVTVVATDKTGTLTEGTMRAELVWTPDGEFVADGNGYEPAGSLAGSGPRPGRLLRDVVLCNDAELRAPQEAGAVWTPVGDPLEAALLALAARGGVEAGPLRAAYPRLTELPFDSVRWEMTTVHATADPDTVLVVTKGAPEVLPDDDDARKAAARLSARGFRVLAVADAEVPASSAPDQARGDLRLAGLVAITDPVRRNAGEVVRSFDAAGVDLLLITGDAPGTARAVANRIGLDGERDRVLTGADLDAGVDPGPRTGARVFARIRPEQKLDIVRAWQEHGEVVAMTGDGVNDGPALRRADIGVAMGRGGTEVARQAADLVLTDDNLGTVVAAIAEGRRIYANVRTFLRYGLSGGLAEVLVMLAGPLTGLAVPLLPAQILWINMLTHGLPGVAIGAEPAAPDAMRRGPRPPSEQVLGAGLWRRIAWGGALIAALTLGVALWGRAYGAPWQTMAFLVLGLAQLGVALALRRPREPGGRRIRFLDLAVLGAAVVQVGPLAVRPLRDLLGIEPVSLAQLAIAVVVAAVPGTVVRLSPRRSAPE